MNNASKGFPGFGEGCLLSPLSHHFRVEVASGPFYNKWETIWRDVADRNIESGNDLAVSDICEVALEHGTMAVHFWRRIEARGRLVVRRLMASLKNHAWCGAMTLPV